MTHRNDHGQQDRRTRIIAAAIAGLLSGAARALTMWLLDQLTAEN